MKILRRTKISDHFRRKSRGVKEFLAWYKIFILTIVVGGVASMSFQMHATTQVAPWVAPKSADTIKNPLKGNAQALIDGKKLYTQYCVVCHGSKGRGDGIAAAGLNPKPADHASAKVQSQSDGAIFWKLTAGKPPMASYATTLTVTQRWQLVNYIRTLKI